MATTNRLTGNLFIAAAIALFIPYTALTIIFEYPAILRQDTAILLTKFNEGGNRLIWTWLAFALTGLPLIPAYILLGRRLGTSSRLAPVATTIGVIGLVAQMIGLLRWVFVVPVLSDVFVHATDQATRTAVIISFKTIHQFAGVLLGEHIGQLFTVCWTALTCLIAGRLAIFPKWLVWLGYLSCIIYFLGQAELLATVMPGIIQWDLAGFIGSSLWLIWMIIAGFRLRKQNI